MTNAYDAKYLPCAMESLGEMVDYAVNRCAISMDRFWDMFLATGYAEQFGAGVPKVVAGWSGTELAWEVLRKAGLSGSYPEPLVEENGSPEFWCGWSMAYYQWYTGRSFRSIRRGLSMEEVCQLYPRLHQADEGKFVEEVNRILGREANGTRLKVLRMAACYSQRQLAEKSGTTLQAIQAYEVGGRSINEAPAATLVSLAQALGCQVTDLMEHESGGTN